MTVHYRIMGDSIVVLGHTFPHKDTLKVLGARFNGAQKVWSLPHSPENVEHLERFCRSVGGGLLQSFDAEKPAVTNPPASPAKAGASAALIPPDSYLVSQLLARVHMTINEAFPRAVWVIGEIQNLSMKTSGLFFDLAERKAADRPQSSASLCVKATLWHTTLTGLDRSAARQQLSSLLAEGMRVRLLCQVGFYRDRGQLSLNVVDIDPNFTKGELAMAREALLKELRAKGLDQQNKNRSLAAFPLRVGLISADNARAQSDFLDQLWSYKYCGEVYFYPAQMQGERVIAEVTAGLRRLVAENCDVIVITRGGGSAADLRWFDAREIAYAIAACPVPVVAAIGHHEDICVAEEICFLRQKTPTAAADFIVSCCQATSLRIDQNATKISRLLNLKLASLISQHQALRQGLATAALRVIERRTQTLDDRAHDIHSKFISRFHVWRTRLANLGHALCNRATGRLAVQSDQLTTFERHIIRRDPTPWMQAGWTQLFSTAGAKAIKSIDEVNTGDEVKSRLLDGRLTLTVHQKDRSGSHEPSI